MLRYLSKTITALCHDIAAMQNNNPAAHSGGTSDSDVTAFVFEQLQKMPNFLSWPVLLATALFGVSRLLIEGSFFHQRSQERRRTQVDRWRNSKFGPNRDLMKFYTSLVVFAFYSSRKSQTNTLTANV
jgi:hypothetical protein